MATTKLTKKDYFTSLLSITEVASQPELVAFINHELELLAKKNSAEKKPTENQLANRSYEKDILSFLVGNKGATITDIQKSIDTDGTLSNQRVSAIVRNLITAGKVERFEEKRKAYFKLAE